MMFKKKKETPKHQVQLWTASGYAGRWTFPNEHALYIFLTAIKTGQTYPFKMPEQKYSDGDVFMRPSAIETFTVVA